MKRKKLYLLYGIIIALLPVILIILMRFDSPEELLSPPSLYGENSEIQTAFEDSLEKNSEIVLQYPTAGNYRSAFVLYDIDCDDEDEAIVFYSLKSNANTVRMNILDCTNKEWKSIYDEEGYGAKIIAIDFDDLNKDGNIEVITRWGLYESTTSKTLAIYEAKALEGQELALTTLANQSYTYMGIADLNDDGYDEILVTWLDTSDTKLTKSYASLLSQSRDGKIYKTGDNVALDASVSAYSSLKIQKVDGRVAAFLDAFKGEDTMITELIWWDANTESLVAPMLDKNSLTNTQTLRSPAIASADINGDGLIEIPLVEKSADSSSTLLSLYGWYIPTPNGLEHVSYGFINTDLGIYFKLPEEYEKHVIARRSLSDNVTTFYWSDDGVSIGNPLFSLVVASQASIAADVTYTFKVNYEGYSIYGTLTNVGETVGFTNELIESSFVFLNDLT